MRIFIFCLSVFVSLNCIQAQTFDLILPGYVNNYETKSKLVGVSLYVVQDGKTISKAITNSVGDYSISAKINKNIPFEIIASKPNYLSKRIYFDFKALKFKGNNAVIQAAEELLIELFQVRQGVTIVVGPNDYAEKFLWDDNQNIMIPDVAFKKLADDKIITAFKDFEIQGLVSKFMTKSESFAQVKNYEKAISYCDSALVLNNKDSVVIKKKIAFKKNLDAVIAEEKRQEEIKLIAAEGDALIGQGNLDAAMAKFTELGKKDAGNAYSLKQIEVIKQLKKVKAEEEADAKKLISIKSNAVKFQTAKKYKEAIAEYDKGLKLKIKQEEKDKLNIEIATLNNNLKGAALEIEISNELKSTKVLNATGSYDKSKLGYVKIENLIAQLLTEGSKKIQRDLVNKQIDESIGKELKTAYDLNSKNQYDKAIETYKKAEMLVGYLTDENLKNSKLVEVKGRVQEVLKKKEEEEKKYKNALDQVALAIDNAPGKLAEANSLLAKEPLKSKATTPEVVALKVRLGAVTKYYKDKPVKIKVVASKDSSKALVAIKELFVLAQSSKVSNAELLRVTISLDSLQKIVAPVKISKPNTAGTKLSTPGEQVIGNTTDAFQQLDFTRNESEKAKATYLQDLKNDIDKENEFQTLTEASRQADASKDIQDQKTQIELIGINNQAEAIERQKEMAKIVNATNLSIQQREEMVLQEGEKRAKEIQLMKNDMDAQELLKQNELAQIHALQELQVIKAKTEIELINIQKAKENVELAAQLQRNKTILEYSQFQKDSISKKQQESSAKDIQKLKNYVPVNITSPNYLRDEKNICFPWNSVTERVYEIKNTDGYVVTVIVRRVVVDPNGFGVVYEHTRNERGISSFTCNGSTITEFIWTNESKGANVIHPELTIITACE